MVEIQKAPCAAGSDKPTLQHPVTKEEISVLFEPTTDGVSYYVRLDVDVVLGGSAMALIVRDCQDAVGIPDYTGNCVGGRPMMMCIDLLTHRQLPATDSTAGPQETTTPATTAPPTTFAIPCQNPDLQPTDRCVEWRDLGYCLSTHRFNAFMEQECAFTCARCEDLTPAPTPTPTNSPTQILTTPGITVSMIILCRTI